MESNDFDHVRENTMGNRLAHCSLKVSFDSAFQTGMRAVYADWPM